MKTIHVSEELEQFLRESVQSGRYASEESVINDALERLRQTIVVADSATSSQQEGSEEAKPLTKQRFQQHLVEIGLLDEPSDHNRQEVESTSSTNEEDVLSEVLIRERLIEWLTGFLDK